MIHTGDCLDVLKTMPDESVDAVVTDPPYFKVKGDGWDNQWANPDLFIDWVRRSVQEWYRLLKPNGSLYCFASPKMAARVELVVAEWFNVLNQIVWVKGDRNGNGMHSRQCKEECRGWFPQTERVIFAEHYGADNIAKGEAGYAAQCDKLRGFVFESLRAYLASERDRAGWTTRRVAEEYQKKTGSRTVTGMAGHWFEQVQWALPTAENYVWLRDLFNRSQPGEFLCREYEELRKEYEELRKEYEELRKEYEELRRPFQVTKDVQYTDVWTFATVPTRKGKHPCEKPLDLMRHILKASVRPGGVVLDPFMGSGTTGVACALEGMQFVGIEQDPAYVEIAQQRIAAAANGGTG